ncbi:MAG: hypothetical protein FD122_693 [Stygiobacter sp.]|nr:MAG: hypothetical protein FD122_693 [Stygiobacter sp.]KAF0213754.1 MAG: hypothetical protein FD178_2803 [Ignavibacteria bacterium]
MQPISKINSFTSSVWEKKPQDKILTGSETKSDSVEISNTAKVYDKVDKFLNLGDSDRLDIGELNEAERKEFLKMLSALIKKGIVGYEVLDVNGKPEKHFVDNQIGDKRLKGVKLYKKKDFYIVRK